MSSMPAVMERPLTDEPWVELDDSWEAAETTALDHGDSLTFEALPHQADADFEAMLRAQEVPLVRDGGDADGLRELMRRPAPERRPPRPLPLDE